MNDDPEQRGFDPEDYQATARLKGPKMTIITETEREVLLQAIRSMNPREDTMGALLSKTTAGQKLGDTGVVQLAKKLEGRE
jgi:hypothetical protein